MASEVGFDILRLTLAFVVAGFGFVVIMKFMNRSMGEQKTRR